MGSNPTRASIKSQCLCGYMTGCGKEMLRPAIDVSEIEALAALDGAQKPRASAHRIFASPKQPDEHCAPCARKEQSGRPATKLTHQRKPQRYPINLYPYEFSSLVVNRNVAVGADLHGQSEI